MPRPRRCRDGHEEMVRRACHLGSSQQHAMIASIARTLDIADVRQHGDRLESVLDGHNMAYCDFIRFMNTFGHLEREFQKFCDGLCLPADSAIPTFTLVHRHINELHLLMNNLADLADIVLIGDPGDDSDL